MKPSLQLPTHRPALSLAPMQDVTDLPFWNLMASYGGADIYTTEYFRVHCDSNLEKHIVQAITQNRTKRPVLAQMIGEDIPSLVRTARQLEQLPVAGIDLNLGCPAPVVCKKNAGGGLLKEPDKIHRILEALRSAISTNFTVKTRVGFATHEEFSALLDIFSQYEIDALAIHVRTVKEMYRPVVHDECLGMAVERLKCPIFANGSVLEPQRARELRERHGVHGVMIGRGAICDPWVFDRIRADWGDLPTPQPTLLDLRQYIQALFNETRWDGGKELHHVNKMKKYMNFIAQAVDSQFLHDIRRVTTERDFFAVCDRHLCTSQPYRPALPHLTNAGNPRLDCYG